MKRKSKKNIKVARAATLTQALEPVKPGANSNSPKSTLRVRAPFWHADACPPGGDPGTGTPADPAKPPRRQVFQEELVGRLSGGGYESFPVEFNYKGVSTQWILGSKIDKNPVKNKSLTAFVRELAVKVRRYNASLYRLRRLHYCNRYNVQNWPDMNPNGGDWDDQDPTAGTPKEISDRIANIEQNWCKVTDDLDDFVENATSGPGYSYNGTVLKLVGLDTVAVNGYVISMRVAVDSKSKSGRWGKLQVDGSSSHVSISSPFSSSAL